MTSKTVLKATASAVALAAGCGVATSAFANDDVLAHIAAGDVVQPNINYQGWNYSPFDQINTDNVGDLSIQWTLQLGVLDQWEASPLVVGDTMYVVSPVNQSEGSGQTPNTLIAIDLTTDGTILWEFRPDVDNEGALTACCGDQTRGLQYAEGNIYYHTLDGQVFGIDGTTGEALWRSVGADVTIREHAAGNGIVIGDLYIIGNEGGESGVRGKVSAFDIHSGQTQWVMYNMGPDNEVGIGPRFNPYYDDDKAGSLATWYGDSWRRGGGTVWGYFTYDPDSNQFFYSSGNCGPWNPDYRREWGVIDLDENNGVQSYKNNWCASMMSRDATTGELIWAYNMTPQDMWDYDEPLNTPLVDADVNGDGSVDQTAMKAARTGYFYIWDRMTGEMLQQPWPFVYNNFVAGHDMETGRTLYHADTLMFTDVDDRANYTDGQDIFNDDQRGDPEFTGTEVYTCPFIAARNWQNTAWNPELELNYVATTSSCGGLRAIEGEYVAGEGYILMAFNPFGAIYGPFGIDGSPEPAYNGQLQAQHPVNGIAWTVDHSPNNNVPVFATAGGLVFQGGSNDGAMHAYNAATGEELWTSRVGSDFAQSAISYIGPDGRQYIAIIASSSSTGQVAYDDAANDADRYRRAGTTLFVWALPQSVAGGM
ncbi:MAG: PQQ-binding-like beta-propeller repeat protein [Anaerolineae bacterium]|nr:PQQ-binding-like beta-propeller repeat protein [Anaerolineae bacterium]